MENKVCKYCGKEHKPIEGMVIIPACLLQERDALRSQVAKLTKERDEAISIKTGYVNNLPSCGACAEAIICGSIGHQHDINCIYHKYDRLQKQVRALNAGARRRKRKRTRTG